MRVIIRVNPTVLIFCICFAFILQNQLDNLTHKIVPEMIYKLVK